MVVHMIAAGAIVTNDDLDIILLYSIFFILYVAYKNSLG